MRSTTPTMQDVASAAKVGKATVSLALRNDPRLRPETRLRIQKTAERLGYRPNATVANLMAQLRASRTPKYQATLGLINASPYRDAFTGLQTFQDWLSGVNSRASQLGYGIDEFWLNDPAIQPGRLVSILESRGIRGLIIAAVLSGGHLPEAFRVLWKRFASVVIGVRTTNPPLHFACNDQYFTALEAIRRLIDLGYQRPGLVMSKELDAQVDYRFTAGFWSGQQFLPASQRLPILPFEETAEKAFRSWVRRARPDVIVCIHARVRAWIEEMGLRAPEDVGLVHLDRTDGMEGWAGMRQNNDLVGFAAVDILVGQLHRNESGVPDFPKCILVQSTWTSGRTLRVG